MDDVHLFCKTRAEVRESNWKIMLRSSKDTFLKRAILKSSAAKSFSLPSHKKTNDFGSDKGLNKIKVRHAWISKFDRRGGRTAMYYCIYVVAPMKRSLNKDYCRHVGTCMAIGK